MGIKNIQGDLNVTGSITSGNQVVSITYAALKALRDGSELTPGQQYRITDYTCTTSTSNTSSAGHVFDIIVIADSVNVLNENARAAIHTGDTYFANSDLNSWELKYCIDNDTSRFAWADSTNGKGVIYYMKDEFSNECPYDFKNILFTATDKYTNAYTFTYTSSSVLYDASMVGLSKYCYSNVIKEYISTSNKRALNFNVFYSTSTTFNCYGNTFGTYCYNNTFGYNCRNNIFGNYCYGNTFNERDCAGNIFGNNCQENTFGRNCNSNIFGNSCGRNKFGEYCSHNTFGNGCGNNNFGNSSSTINYCSYNIFDNSCSYINLLSTDTSASSGNQLKNVHVRLGVKGTYSALLDITIPDRNLPYETDCYLDDTGNLVISRFAI